MAGTITFSGVGSGIDTESIVSGLVQASQGTLNALKTKVSSTQSAVTSLSNISSLLGKLKTAVSNLATATGVGSYAASSSSSAIAVTAAGNALPGSYDITVPQLAKEQRTYSTAASSASDAFGQAGVLQITIGGTTTNVDVNSSDSLDQIASNINASGARVSAAVLFDGSQYRMQIRGLDSGADNAISFTQLNGLDLGVNASGATVQQAQNSIIQIDGFNIERSTNQVSGAIPGVTLALTAQSFTPVTVQVQSDPKGLETKLQALVDAYNSVVSTVQTTTGYGSTAASVSALAGDSTLRSLTNRMSSVLGGSVSGSGSLSTLASIGLTKTRDGKLSLDTSKLEQALTSDASAVSAILAGPSGSESSGLMDMLSGVIDIYNQTGTGLLSQHVDSYNSKISDLNDSVSREQDRLTRYADQLRTQFTAMDSTVAANQSLVNYLTKL